MTPKLIVILGPTASGKSALAVNLAKKFNGEVVSADSRQVYRGMDLGSGKITKREMRGVPHHLLDVSSPKTRFDVTKYRKLAEKSIAQIIKRGKLPILCGGTGFYIQAVVDGIVIPEVKPDWRLRSNLERLTTGELFEKLKKLDPIRAKTIDKSNPRRLIRALEIVIKTGKSVPILKKQPLPYPVLLIGIKKQGQIAQRVAQMIKNGLEKEVKNLIKKYGWTPALQSIGYLEWRNYLDKKINAGQVKDLIVLHTNQYAKRQMTWFKRDNRIHWIQNQKEAAKLTDEFLREKFF